MALDPQSLETPSLLLRRFTPQDVATMLVLSQEEPSRTWLPSQVYQRRGLATEALIAASRWALRAFELERILGITAAAHVASKRALARAGFAHQRDEMMNFQGTEQPVSVYALCRGAGDEGGA